MTKAQKMRLAFDTGKQRAKMMRERAVLCCDCMRYSRPHDGHDPRSDMSAGA